MSKIKVKVDGFFEIRVIRRLRKGRFGIIYHEFVNGVTNEGLNNMLGVTFHGDTQTSWYFFPISNASFSILSVNDTMASHAGWTEATAYDETTRQQWITTAPAAKSITNTTYSLFTISTDGTIFKGMGLASNNTKGGTTGKLWSTGLFSADQTYLTGDLVQTKYTVNLS
jgi:hypothetical protein